MFARKFQVAVCLLLWVVSAQAQNNLGELLDKGAKKLGKNEYVAALPATFSFVWPNKQGEAELLYKLDGTLSGHERHYQSNSTSASTGTWTIDETGKWCSNKSLEAWGTTFKGCVFGFTLGDEYFFSASDSDRDSRVLAVKLKK